MNIPDEIVEKAAKAVFRGLHWKGISDDALKNQWYENDDKRKEAIYHARAALAAVLPDLTAAAVAEEREACAKIAEEIHADGWVQSSEARKWGQKIAAAIRARSNKPSANDPDPQI